VVHTSARVVETLARHAGGDLVVTHAAGPIDQQHERKTSRIGRAFAMVEHGLFAVAAHMLARAEATFDQMRSRRGVRRRRRERAVQPPHLARHLTLDLAIRVQ
jgi:hypothetical protein